MNVIFGPAEKNLFSLKVEKKQNEAFNVFTEANSWAQVAGKQKKREKKYSTTYLVGSLIQSRS